ncbi:MAG TPA: Spy/CpxP family protein refolding chaperone [Gallionellaceae bacterium]|nr:Spy/CpxP family protein refolding chaperone [Gallionellaceae bacterium]
MMGGYGPGYGMGQGMGQGMMGYGSGYGMGPGMMGGGYGMGHGMMGYGDYRELGLSSDQQGKITQIRKAVRAKHWALMDDMMDAQDRLQELYDADKQDAAAINRQYKVIDDLRRQMVENSVDANNRINAILTKEQREKLHERGRGYGPMMRGY